MGKRSNFERIERDFYETPEAAVTPLLAHLPLYTQFSEPCVGSGALVRALEAHGHRCLHSCDIGSPYESSPTLDVQDVRAVRIPAHCEAVITNPPWDRKVLHPAIVNLSRQKPTWLLFDADWVHTKQASPYMSALQKIVSVGRVKWIKDSPHTGKDNCCWYLFDASRFDNPVQFFGRTK